MSFKKPLKYSLLAIAVLALILVPYFLWGDRFDAFVQSDFMQQTRSQPWLCALILGGLLALDILLPVPSSIISTLCGTVLGTTLGTLTSALGMTLSVILGYGLMRLGSPWVRRWLGGGASTASGRRIAWVIAMRPVPVLAEASVMGAGLLGVPFWRLLLGTTIANLLISLVYAWLGARLGEGSIFVITFCGVLALSGIALFVLKGKINSAAPEGTAEV